MCRWEEVWTGSEDNFSSVVAASPNASLTQQDALTKVKGPLTARPAEILSQTATENLSRGREGCSSCNRFVPRPCAIAS